MAEREQEGQVGNVQFVTGSFAPQPTRPVREYCQAFEDWRKAIAQAIERGDFDHDESTKKRWQEIVQALNTVSVAIYKSNLLYRLIYLGEELRTEKCPEHDGHWQGYGWNRECACQDLERGTSGPDITGWLPARHLPAQAEPDSGEANIQEKTA